MKVRIDQLLVDRSFVADLDTAKAMIMAGAVIVNDQRVDGCSEKYAEDVRIRLKRKSPFVSRGGEKLDLAIVDLGIHDSFEAAVVLDIGASTGGFTDCCLKRGAAKVFAVDVGRGQFAWQLRHDNRVALYESSDIRTFSDAFFAECHWVLADISFNSLARLLPDIKRVVAPAGVKFLLLVKPQFELPRDDVPRGGVVSLDSLRSKALGAVVDIAVQLGFAGFRWVDSRQPGKDGNREIFLYCQN